ncbi:hypothetical protein EGT67_18925 [Prescottella agglutinans]|uniref:Polyketide cyclase n=1 Tax=Prescottella agglutinans TaxID=1644129 RepID=A0A3S3AE18_9NOCA|nr:SRPBCC family protein [Prescottella agglutinans]RVW08001.1 hypothetical protein EGT67_18925 [Prescottella agglutinans]
MARTLETSETVVIDRPLPEVFRYMTNPDNLPEWSSNVIEYKVLSGAPNEVGAVMDVTVRVAGVRIHATEELSDYQENKVLRIRSKESKIGYDREIDFASDGDGATQVTFRQKADAGSGLFKFADAVVVKMYARDVRSNLENAKAILESADS